MAITKLMHMKSASSGSSSSHLKNAIDYILQEKKVAVNETQQKYAASQGCILEQAYKNMLQTKEQYGKTGGRQGYHFVISFKPGEVTQEQLWKITQDFVKEYLKGYEAVYAIHSDTDHLHSHIIFNSVNYKTGYKYHYCNGDWEKEIQPVVDRLCMENGAPVLSYHVDEYDENGEKKKFYTYSKNFNWTKEIKADIDDCVQISKEWSGFIRNMLEKGYSINYGKSVSVRKAGMKRCRRLKENTMGYEYTPEGIIERIYIQNGRYKLKSAGTIISGNSLTSQKYRKKAFRSYSDMDFYEKALVRHMLRIRAAIPQYKVSPGNWYASRKVNELHRKEKELMLIRKYGINGDDGIRAALTDLNSKENKIKATIKHQEFISREYEELINAYKKIEEYESGADIKYGEYVQSKQKISDSAESMQDIKNYINNAEENRNRYKSEIKEIKRQKSILLSMLEKQKDMTDKARESSGNNRTVNRREITL